MTITTKLLHKRYRSVKVYKQAESLFWAKRAVVAAKKGENNDNNNNDNYSTIFCPYFGSKTFEHSVYNNLLNDHNKM